MSSVDDSATLGPLILVGLPRSGSTLLSRLLNESPQGFMVNDFYFLQKVEGLGAFESIDIETRRELLSFIAEQIRNRTQPEGVADEVWFGIPLVPEQTDLLDEYVAGYQAPDDETWAETLANVMSFVSGLCGRDNWGWNTPQDYLHADEILRSFPDARFIFLLRSPAKMLLSYKFYWTVVSKFEGDRGRYHPVVQSLAWRSCAKAYLGMSESLSAERCILVTLEDVVDDTASVMAALEDFSGWKLPTVDVGDFGHNSSLTSDRGSDRVLTGLEQAICRRITKKTQLELGFAPVPASRWGARDIADLSKTTVRNVAYYGRGLASSVNTRRRVARFVRAQFGR